MRKTTLVWVVVAVVAVAVVGVVGYRLVLHKPGGVESSARPLGEAPGAVAPAAPPTEVAATEAAPAEPAKPEEQPGEGLRKGATTEEIARSVGIRYVEEKSAAPKPEEPDTWRESAERGATETQPEVTSNESGGLQAKPNTDRSADKAAREAEIRIEYRSLQRSRAAYDQMVYPSWRVTVGVGEGPRARAADAAWDEVVQQDAVVRGLLDAYASHHGGPARDAFVAREQMDMTQPVPKHLLREKRRELRNEMSRKIMEEMNRATPGAGEGR